MSAPKPNGKLRARPAVAVAGSGWDGAEHSSDGNKVLSCYGAMSGYRGEVPHCCATVIVIKSALTFGIKQKLIVKIETEPLR